MNINATLFIQIINFGVAFLLFRFLLFKPAMAIIEQERVHVDSLNKLVETDRAHLEERRKQVREQWGDARKYFEGHVPEPVSVNFFRGIAPKITYTPPSSAVLAKETQVMTKSIVDLIGSRNVH